jgi:hypothetical protein
VVVAVALTGLIGLRVGSRAARMSPGSSLHTE